MEAIVATLVVGVYATRYISSAWLSIGGRLCARENFLARSTPRSAEPSKASRCGDTRECVEVPEVSRCTLTPRLDPWRCPAREDLR